MGVADWVLEEVKDTLLLVLWRVGLELELDRMTLEVSLAMEDELEGTLLALLVVIFAVLLALDPVVGVSTMKSDVVAFSAELEEVVVAKCEPDELVIS